MIFLYIKAFDREFSSWLVWLAFSDSGAHEQRAI